MLFECYGFSYCCYSCYSNVMVFHISNWNVLVMHIFMKGKLMAVNEEKMAKHVFLNTIEEFVRNKIYPENIAKDKGKKSNFRKACKVFSEQQNLYPTASVVRN